VALKSPPHAAIRHGSIVAPAGLHRGQFHRAHFSAIGWFFKLSGQFSLIFLEISLFQ